MQKNISKIVLQIWNTSRDTNNSTGLLIVLMICTDIANNTCCFRTRLYLGYTILVYNCNNSLEYLLQLKFISQESPPALLFIYLTRTFINSQMMELICLISVDRDEIALTLNYTYFILNGKYVILSTYMLINATLAWYIYADSSEWLKTILFNSRRFNWPIPNIFNNSLLYYIPQWRFYTIT